MRLLLALLGLLAIFAYAICGALLMNDWAVSAAAGVPLDEAIATMRAAGQPYSAGTGVLFAVLGIVAGLLWGAAAMPRRRAIPGLAAAVL